MTAQLSCAVIGAGAMGAAAAYSLAKRGAKVRLFEQFSLHHDQGSSHGATRLFRTAYFEHPDYVPLLKRALKMWRDLESESGEELLVLTGVMMAGPHNCPLIAGTRQAAKEHGLALTSLTGEQFAERFPRFSIPTSFEALIEPEAGYVSANKAVAAFLDGARANGAEIIDNCAVEKWNSTKDAIDIFTQKGKFTADRLVIAPGAWASGLLDDIGRVVSPLRKTLYWAASEDAAFSVGGGFLPFAIQQEDDRFFYGFPAVDADGIKLAEHTGGVPVASLPDTAAPPVDEEGVKDFLARHAPGLPCAITKIQNCLYEMTPDGHFIFGKHPTDARVAYAAGHSGHGFKFAPVIGDAIADLALNGETLREFDFLNPSRFES